MRCEREMQIRKCVRVEAVLRTLNSAQYAVNIFKFRHAYKRPPNPATALQLPKPEVVQMLLDYRREGQDSVVTTDAAGHALVNAAKEGRRDVVCAATGETRERLQGSGGARGISVRSRPHKSGGCRGKDAKRNSRCECANPGSGN